MYTTIKASCHFCMFQTDMRKQDVALMKQMININETIQNIANRRSTFQMKSRNGCKRNNSMYEGPTYVMEVLKVKSLKQSTSVPCCSQLSKELGGSLSSIEGKKINKYYICIEMISSNSN